MSRKKIIILFLATVVVVTIAVVLYFTLEKNKEDKYISNALAAKMLTLLDTDKDNLPVDGDNWYDKYIEYMKAYDIEFGKAKKPCTYNTIRKYLEIKNIDKASLFTTTGVKLDGKKENEKINRTDFCNIYSYLAALDENGRVKIKEMSIVGTPSNNDKASKWQANTTDGVYYFEGLTLDCYMDTTIKAYVRGNEIIYVLLKTNDNPVYKNVWLAEGSGNKVSAYIGGMNRIFSTNTLQNDFSGTVGDIYMENGEIVRIVLKNQTIDGKVLMVGDDTIEIESYGVMELDENFHVYKNYGIFEEVDTGEIMVGYDLTDFIVSGDKICAAIISETLTADRIRVLIMSSGFTSLFHDRISFTATGDFKIKSDTKELTCKTGEIIDIYDGCSLLGDGRIFIETVNDTDKIQILSVERNKNAPSYRGRMEITEGTQGLILVNDVAIEEYLYAVVPSEMPDSYGVEALKVQAVCARSYAYRQLLNNSYAKYGAHVDDSVNYQVYNNSGEKANSTEAVRETYGQVVSDGNDVVTTYYYSTSCGHSSDNSAWGGNPDNYTYLSSKDIDSSGNYSDLSTEEAFRQFINSMDENDYDYGFPYYRWNLTLTDKEISQGINENIYSRYCASPSNIKVLKNGIWISQEIKSVGTVQNIEVQKRNSGGAITSLIIYGDEAVVKIENELNVRYIINPGGKEILLNGGATKSSYMLPSAFVDIKKTQDGYSLCGGGYGHGIGMSQNAVSTMVKDGMTYDEIIAFFYEKTKLVNVYQNE